MDGTSDSSDEDLVPTNYHWVRFKWMLWVDCCKHWNKRWQFLFAMLMPTILSLIVILMRFEISAEHITATTYPTSNLERAWTNLKRVIKERQNILQDYFETPTFNTFTPQIIIGYAPNNQAYDDIINIARQGLDVEWKNFSTCEELRTKMSKDYYLAGICFKQTLNNRTDAESADLSIYPKRLDFSLIFPSELRIYNSKIGDTWDTTNLYIMPLREEHSNGFMAYIDEGFIMLQRQISEAFISLTSAESKKIQVYLRKLPVVEHYYDPLSEVILTRMSLLLVLGYATPVLYLLKSLVIERQKKLDSMLAILDVTPFIQFYSWFVFTLASMSIASFVLLLVLKIPWNNGFAVFNNVTFTCLYVLMTAFNIYTLSFCYMMSKFFRSPKVAITAAPIFWILFYLPFASSIQSTKPLSETLHTIVSLFGNSAFGFAIKSIYHLENTEGLHWNNFFKRALSSQNFSVGTYTLIMCGVSIVQALIGICVTKVDKCLLNILKKLRRHTDGRIGSENSRYSKTIILEVRANYKPSAVEVISVSVERDNKLILDDISFSLYENEITMLMGHNGSGKTMLIKVLAGITSPKSGKVVYAETNDNKLYTSSSDFTGVCFNDSMLFYNLNVKHQLMFFGRMKGVISVQLKKELKKYLEALELDNYKYVRTEELTCGQRTKMAVACALIGGSKIILLDDIVLKLDVRDYDLVWKLLEKEKFGRVILASTNLSLEPEFHADNIIILGQGRVKCTGTGQFLKSLYCFGCHLLIAKEENCKEAEVTKVLNQFIPDITPAAHIGREISYHIESSNIEILESILHDLEAKKEQLDIMNITIIETPVEELFCKLGAERPAYDDRKRYLRIFNGLSIMHEDNHDLVFLKRRINYQMSAFQKSMRQWTALYYKHFIFYWAHKAPLVLNLVYNAILRHNTLNDNRIDVELELLKMESKVAVSELSRKTFNMGAKLAMHIGIIICYSVCVRVMLSVSERTSGFQNLQRIAGLSAFNEWICLFALDLSKHFIVMSISTVFCFLLLPSVYASLTVLRWCFCLLMLGCTSMTSVNYVLSLFFKSSHVAYLFITTIHSMGMSFFIAYYGDLVDRTKFLTMLPRIFPLYSFCHGLTNIYSHNIQNRLCQDEIVRMVSTGLEDCKKIPNCCAHKDLETDDDAFYLWMIIGNAWVCILIYECRGLFKREVPIDNYDRALDEYKRRHASDSIEVDEVTAEMIHVQSLKPRMRYYYTAVCENLGLIKKGKILVDRVSFTIEPGKSLGIIGTNCNYTNALLNILTGTPCPSFGRVYINGVSMTEERAKAISHIGYVPTVSCVMGEMTCKEVLKMFCILYGYARNEIDEICENFAKNCGFYTQYNTQIQRCSSGIKERISYAIAILKKPALLCIGNYSFSVDPHGRRQLYRLVVSLCDKNGTAIAITSVNNCYTEILCHKLIVMNDGQFIHVGQPRDLAPDINRGYVVSMRMKKAIQTPQGVMPKVFFRLTAFMEKTFPSSQLVQEGAVMQYFIPIKSTTLALIFKNLRANAFQLNIESLSITSMNMSYIFGRITEEALRKYSTSA
ncbi:phospholipid-transporting ATPase ABCA3-like isoform X2 [Eurosta solidaginis]|uniref:phospholipid-transporting ATPase ABCA3-like isoform X2 n=1 Tax=Eurosta solidaginis TaxID=178769 RepID=UPI003530EE3C